MGNQVASLGVEKEFTRRLLGGCSSDTYTASYLTQLGNDSICIDFDQPVHNGLLPIDIAIASNMWMTAELIFSQITFDTDAWVSSGKATDALAATTDYMTTQKLILLLASYIGRIDLTKLDKPKVDAVLEYAKLAKSGPVDIEIMKKQVCTLIATLYPDSTK